MLLCLFLVGIKACLWIDILAGVEEILWLTTTTSFHSGAHLLTILFLWWLQLLLPERIKKMLLFIEFTCYKMWDIIKLGNYVLTNTRDLISRRIRDHASTGTFNFLSLKWLTFILSYTLNKIWIGTPVVGFMIGFVM